MADLAVFYGKIAVYLICTAFLTRKPQIRITEKDELKTIKTKDESIIFRCRRNTRRYKVT